MCSYFSCTWVSGYFCPNSFWLFTSVMARNIGTNIFLLCCLYLTGDPDDLVPLARYSQSDLLTDWRDISALNLLNLVYDVTPSHFVSMVITEVGMIPCTSVPVVLRVQNPET